MRDSKASEPYRLTDVQAETLKAVISLSEGGRPPSHEELARRLGVRRQTVAMRLVSLQVLGCVSAPPRTLRAVVVTALGHAKLRHASVPPSAHCVWCEVPIRKRVLSLVGERPVASVAAEVGLSESAVSSMVADARRKGCIGYLMRQCDGNGCDAMVPASHGRKYCDECAPVSGWRLGRTGTKKKLMPVRTCELPGCDREFTAQGQKRFCTRQHWRKARAKGISSRAPAFVLRLRQEVPDGHCLFCSEPLPPARRVVCGSKRCLNDYNVEYKREMRMMARGEDPYALLREDVEDGWAMEMQAEMRQAAQRRELLLGDMRIMRRQLEDMLGAA